MAEICWNIHYFSVIRYQNKEIFVFRKIETPCSFRIFSASKLSLRLRNIDLLPAKFWKTNFHRGRFPEISQTQVSRRYLADFKVHGVRKWMDLSVVKMSWILDYYGKITNTKSSDTKILLLHIWKIKKWNMFGLHTAPS